MSYLSLLAEITVPTESPWTIVKSLDTYGPLGAFVAIFLLGFLGWKYVGQKILSDILAITTNFTTITLNLKDLSKSQEDLVKSNAIIAQQLVILQAEKKALVLQLEQVLIRQSQERPCQNNSLYSPPNHQPPTPNPSTTSPSH
jgi:hypothetical protein